VRVYRWDLDKTYLETDFHSLSGLVRSATEPAHAKRAAPGAAPLLRALAADPLARISIVSGSPEQLRPRLEEKLRLDGVRWDSLVLKDSLGHLKKGQLRAVRGQLGYKLPALLQARAGLGRGTREVLFGDDAEVDALVYSLYADVLAGRVRPRELSRILDAGGVYPEHRDAAAAAAAALGTADAVDRIFIRLEQGRPPADFAVFGPRVVPVFSWWQAAVVLFAEGAVGARAVGAVAEDCAARGGLDTFAFGGLLQDIVRRGAVDPAALGPLELPEAVRAAMGRAPPGGAAPPGAPLPDYVGLAQGWAAGAAPRRDAG
jgi:hypothetical protein